MLSESAVLLYNFKEDTRTAQIRRYLRRNGIQVRMVTLPEYLQPLGTLFGLPGFPQRQLFNLGEDFREEMIVMKGFSGEQLDAFLSFLRTPGLGPAALKAILTPHNQGWNSLQLYRELCKEREALGRA